MALRRSLPLLLDEPVNADHLEVMHPPVLMNGFPPGTTRFNLLSADGRASMSSSFLFQSFSGTKLVYPGQSNAQGATLGRSISEGMLETQQEHMWCEADLQLCRWDYALRGPSRSVSPSRLSNGRAHFTWTLHDPAPGFPEENMQRDRQELLLRDSSDWRDYRRDKNSCHHPDLRQTWSETLRVGPHYKPAWVDSQLAMRGVPVCTSKSSLDYGAGPGKKVRKEGDSDYRNLIRCCEEGGLSEAVEALALLVQRGCRIDNYVFYSVLKKCIARKDLNVGRRVHALSVKCGYESNAFLANHIIRMYAFHGKLEEAKQVFSNVSAVNTHVWASVILAHARQGQPVEAIKIYRQIRGSKVKPDNHVFVAVLKACATAEDLAFGREVHADILESWEEPNVFVGSSLVDMYAKCGSLGQARAVFDSLHTKNVVTWNAMIGGYARYGCGHEANALYTCMQEDGTTPANQVTYVCLLQACACVRALHVGKQLHAQIKERGLEVDLVVGNSLVNMYAKCGSLDDACGVFNGLPTKDVVTWNAMITGFAHHGLGQEALTFYARMQLEGIIPADQVTFTCLLQACAGVAALNQGKQLHAQIQQSGLEADLVIGNCLIHMYAKCGSIEQACRVFKSLPTRDVITWNALLNGYAEYGDGQVAIRCFRDMLQQGVEPDETTFISLLVACSHEGLVDEGQDLFKTMVNDHAIVPTIYHYTCMIDLLGRAGYLEEAEEMLQTMPYKNAVAGWKSLLSSCKSHGDVERGRRCFEYLLALDPENGAPYVLLGNMYATAGRWGDVDEIEMLRKDAGASKKPAKASIEVKNHVHEFTVGEERVDIVPRLSSLNSRWKEGGHVPHTELVLKEVTKTEKEEALCGHAEKLALAYGLLHTPDGSALLVTKNLRMCNDCHSSTKIMSRLEKREIIVRDAHRLHRFLDGSCSCKDRN